MCATRQKFRRKLLPLYFDNQLAFGMWSDSNVSDKEKDKCLSCVQNTKFIKNDWSDFCALSN